MLRQARRVRENNSVGRYEHDEPVMGERIDDTYPHFDLAEKPSKRFKHVYFLKLQELGCR